MKVKALASNGYVYVMPLTVEPMLKELGYDCPKLTRAVNDNGKAHTKLVETGADKGRYTFTPEKVGKTTAKPAKSKARIQPGSLTFEGIGNMPEQFAAWTTSADKIIREHGKLNSAGIPSGIKSWMDAKFRLGKVRQHGNGKVHGRNGRGGGNIQPNVSAPVAPTATATVTVGAK